MKSNDPTKTRVIDADGHVRETDAEILDFMSAGYRNGQRKIKHGIAPPHHGWLLMVPFRRRLIRQSG